MKYRSDFVTNSSSSSFIIKRKLNEYNNVNDVFRKVRDIYKDVHDIWEQIVEHLKQYDIQWAVVQRYSEHFKKNYTSYEFQDKNGNQIQWFSNDQLRDEVKLRFGLDMIYLHDGILPNWVACETYAEYTKCANSDKKLPFYITNFHDETYKNFNNLDWDSKEILSWYLKCPYNHFSETSLKCTTCGDGDAIDEEDGICYRCLGKEFTTEPICTGCKAQETCATKAYLDKNGRTIQNVFLSLGDFCINSWEGDMPVYVTDRLEKLCSHACVHMG